MAATLVDQASVSESTPMRYSMPHSCPYDQLPSAAGQSCPRNLPSREQGLGLRRARRHRIRDSLGRKPSRPITSADYNSNFSQDRLGFGEVMAGQLASQRSGNHAVLQAGSMMV